MPKLPPLKLQGTCIDLSYEGKGVIKTPKGIVFVDGVLPQEEVEILLTYSRNGTTFGTLKRIIKASPHRIEPACKVFKECGGCSFQNFDYEAELAFKRSLVQDQLKKISDIDASVLEVERMPSPSHYREKIQMPIGGSKKHVIYGFYKTNTHQIINIKSCLLEDEKASKILNSIASLMEKYGIEPYDEDEGRGYIRHILIRTSYHYDDVMVCFISTKESFHNRGDLIKELLKKHPEISTVCLNVNSRKTNVILGEKTFTLKGPGYIRERLGGIEFKISPKSFFQTNVYMAERLFSFVKEEANIQPSDIVYDAYSGTGTIGMILSKVASFVRGVEIEHSSVIDARRTATNNQIRNFEMVEEDATLDIKNLAKQGVKFDVLVLDPPRKGSTPDFLAAVKKFSPRTIIYVSCNPGTLARDLKELLDEYEIVKVKPFDMFPRTFHVETVCVLSKLKSK